MPPRIEFVLCREVIFWIAIGSARGCYGAGLIGRTKLVLPLERNFIDSRLGVRVLVQDFPCTPRL